MTTWYYLRKFVLIFYINYYFPIDCVVAGQKTNRSPSVKSGHLINGTMAYFSATTQTDLSIRCKDHCHNHHEEDSIDSDDDDDSQSNQYDPVERRLNPKCKEDLQLLFTELDLWRNQKLDEIEQKREISVEERIKLRSLVLSKETFLLRKLSKINHSLTAKEQKKKIDDILLEVIRPKKWEISNGETIEVHNTQDIMTSQLIQLYQRLDTSLDQTGKEIQFITDLFDHLVTHYSLIKSQFLKELN